MPPETSPDNAWSALRQKGFLLKRWPWLALAHTSLTVVLWTLFMLPAVAIVLPFGAAINELLRADLAAGTVLLLLGLGLGFTLLPLLASPMVAVDRWRARLVDPASLPSASQAPAEPGAWLRDRYLTALRWRYAGYAAVAFALQTLLLVVLLLLTSISVALIASPFLVASGETVDVGPWQVRDRGSALVLAALGVALLVAPVYAWTAGASLQVSLLRRTLDADRVDRLTVELTEVGASRARLVESFDSERRRIERDLHDGAQQRLVTLAMGLGISRLEVAEALGPEHPASVGVAIAHEQAKGLMDELRAFVRGIHPQVLTDLGLVAALDQLTAAMPIPVDLSSTLDHRPPVQVETTAYFAASEALTNVVRHSGAAHAWVSLTTDGTDVVVEVRDDGRGGAAPRPGSGLIWMADRLAAVHGSLWLSSPTGGPTVVRLRIPESR